MGTDFGEDLKRSGLRYTKRRAYILGVMGKNDRPVTAEQVYLELKEKDIRVNLSTVYRTLEALAEKELIVKINISGEPRTLFELNHKVHRHYLVCLGCKKILAIDKCPLEGYEKTLAEETDFSIEGHKLNIYGYCPECRGKGGRD